MTPARRGEWMLAYDSIFESLKDRVVRTSGGFPGPTVGVAPNRFS
jgi:hypothetical protein